MSIYKKQNPPFIISMANIIANIIFILSIFFLLRYLYISYKSTITLFNTENLIYLVGVIISFILKISISYIKKITEFATVDTEILSEEVEKKTNYMSDIIFSAAFTYLFQQYKVILSFGLIIGVCLFFQSKWITLGFFIGSLTSCIVSFFSMYVCVSTNVRTAIQANRSLKDSFNMAFTGSLSGSMFTNAISLFSIIIMILISKYISNFNNISDVSLATSDFFFGGAFGSAFISIFGRLAGGIFTKAADVGADLVGKVEKELAEDDSRNPATIADNVGDNVGDCNGMITDVFESYFVTFLMAILWLKNNNSFLLQTYIFICGTGLLTTFICKYFINITNNTWGKLQTYFYTNVIIIFLASIGWFFFSSTTDLITSKMSYNYIGCVFTGLLVSVGILKSTEYYTSSEYSPVQELAKSSQSGHGTNIIYGLSISFISVAIPLLLIIFGVIFTYNLCGLIGLSISAISIISLTGAVVSLDLIGPITDNAGGIAETGEMGEDIREITDHLDSVGNVTKAVTKGFSIGCAVFTAIITNIIFIKEVSNFHGIDIICNLTEPVVFCSILIGGIITYIFCGLGLRAVGEAAQAVVENVREQIREKPGILTREEEPDYKSTIKYLTKISILKMIIPALLPIVIPVISFLFYKKVMGEYLIYDFLSGISFGGTIMAIFLSINMTTAGGAWDNSKKYIEEGNLGGKKSFTHSCAVTGDTVGDPYKDTVGPSLNALAKLIPIVSFFIMRFL